MKKLMFVGATACALCFIQSVSVREYRQFSPSLRHQHEISLHLMDELTTC